MRKAIVSATSLAVVVALGGVVHAITNGQLDGNRHPYVALVDNYSYTCSGAAISEKLVVTASHCLASWIPGGDGPVRVSFDAEADLASGHWITGTIHSNPDWCIGCGGGTPGFDTHDVGVVVLDEPVQLPGYAVLPTPGLVDSLPMKTDVEVVGYGIHGWNRGGGPPTGQPVQDFKRYYASAELIASANRQSDEFLKLTANPGQGKGGACIGDSGGPALLANVVLGVTSYVHNLQCTGSTYSNRLDLDYALEFIASFE